MMPELSDYLHSPAWWLTAVILALLLNIVAAFAVRVIERWGGQISSRWSTRTAAKALRRAQLISAVRADANRLIWIGFQAQSAKTTGLLYHGSANLFLVLAMLGAVLRVDAALWLILVLIGLLFVTVATSAFSRATDLEAVIRAVEPEWPALPGA
jgi:hypothetical protein